MHLDLPEELHIYILNVIDEEFDEPERRQTLFACSFVNRRWSRKASRLLWKRPRLTGSQVKACLTPQPNGLSHYFNEIQSLSFASGQDIELSQAIAVARQCPNLTSLGFRYFINPKDVEPLINCVRDRPRLKHLSLKQCFFNLNLADLLVTLQKTALHLESLDLSSCDISSNICDFSVLTINRPISLISNSGVAHADVCRIKQLNMSNNMNLKGYLLTDIIRLFPLLESVYLAGCLHIGDDAFEAIAAWTGDRLKELNAVSTKISSVGLKSITACCRNLVSLKLGTANYPMGGSFQNIDDEAVQTLGRCPRLQVLHLHGYLTISDIGLLDVIPKCQALHELDVSMTAITEKTLLSIQKHLSANLKKLWIIGCSEIDIRSTTQSLVLEDPVMNLLVQCTHLHQLDCSMLPALQLRETAIGMYLRELNGIANETSTPYGYTLSAKDIHRIRKRYMGLQAISKL